MSSVPPITATNSVAGPTTQRPFSADEPTTLVEVFEQFARDHKRSDTLNYKKDGRWIPISSDELLTRARRIAAGLYALGVRRGDRVAILSESRPEWTLIDAGCLFAGAIDVPIYPTLTPPQVRYILKDSGARVLAVSNYEKFLQVKEALRECEAVEHVIFLDGANADVNAGISLAELEARGRVVETNQPQLADELRRNAHTDDLATILYTSGTTGEPKGVMLTHSNLVSNLI